MSGQARRVARRYAPALLALTLVIGGCGDGGDDGGGGNDHLSQELNNLWGALSSSERREQCTTWFYDKEVYVGSTLVSYLNEHGFEQFDGDPPGPNDRPEEFEALRDTVSGFIEDKCSDEPAGEDEVTEPEDASEADAPEAEADGSDEATEVPEPETVACSDLLDTDLQELLDQGVTACSALGGRLFSIEWAAENLCALGVFAAEDDAAALRCAVLDGWDQLPAADQARSCQFFEEQPDEAIDSFLVDDPNRPNQEAITEAVDGMDRAELVEFFDDLTDQLC